MKLKSSKPESLQQVFRRLSALPNLHSVQARQSGESGGVSGSFVVTFCSACKSIDQLFENKDFEVNQMPEEALISIKRMYIEQTPSHIALKLKTE